MIVFKDKITYDEPLNIVFLCGSKLVPTSGKDKRVVLKEYLSAKLGNCRPIILEENFSFAKNTKKYLAYDDIFLVNLCEVEKLAELFADKIIVIHETLSTAAEIGMFAGDTALTSKICILVPDDISIEEDKVSSFIRLAFFNKGDESINKPRKIVYYPDVEIHRKSKNKSGYHTFFHNNVIGENLGRQLMEFVMPITNKKEIKFKKNNYNKWYSDRDVLSYYISEQEKGVNVYIYNDALKIHLMSLFTLDKFRSEFRKEKLIKDHVTYIEDNYKQILLDSICNIEGIDATVYSALRLELIDSKSCDLRQAIGYFLYMLQATGLIGLEQATDGLTEKERKIRISEQMDASISVFRDYIYDKISTEFGGVV